MSLDGSERILVQQKAILGSPLLIQAQIYAQNGSYNLVRLRQARKRLKQDRKGQDKLGQAQAVLDRYIVRIDLDRLL